MKRLGALAMAAMIGLTSGATALAESVAGKPIDAGHHFQRAVTPVMEDIVWLDDFLHIIITLIVIFVTALMAYCVVKFSRKNNPNPATFTHNTTVEIIWTAAPVLILIGCQRRRPEA